MDDETVPPWEYLTELVHNVGAPKRLQHLLNWRGSDGWELVALTPRVKAEFMMNNLGGDMLAIFKRPGLGKFDKSAARGTNLPDNYEEAPY
jgi:hypothetical protein